MYSFTPPAGAGTGLKLPKELQVFHEAGKYLDIKRAKACI
jgi:hypothetical protein